MTNLILIGLLDREFYYLNYFQTKFYINLVNLVNFIIIYLLKSALFTQDLYPEKNEVFRYLYLKICRKTPFLVLGINLVDRNVFLPT